MEDDSLVQDHITALAAPGEDAGCIVPALPSRLLTRAADLAARLNPTNAPLMQAAMGEDGPTVAQLALVTAKYWGRQERTLSVSFLEATANELKQRILLHMNAWNVGVTFALTNGTGQVRISRSGPGYWSYLGTDILLIPLARPTMNLQGFTMITTESEFTRVVRHETGHTLGFPHEHLRRALIDRLEVDNTITYFRNTYGWSEAQTRANVLTPLEERSIMATSNADQDSIMCYQLPAQITRDGNAIRGGADINPADREFARSIYPGGTAPPALRQIPAWDVSEDVSLQEALARARP